MLRWLPVLLLSACGGPTPDDDDVAADDDDAGDAWDPADLPMGDDAVREPLRVWVDYVVDGDTAQVITPDGLGERVRFLAVDTPELNSGEPYPAECWAYEAREFAQDLLPADQVLWLTFDGEERDAFGRLLAYLFLGDEPIAEFERSVNHQLVRGGHASTLFFPNNQTFREQLEYAEYLAWSEDLGMWGCD